MLNADYFDESEVSNEEILDIHSVLTIVNGKVVHDEGVLRRRVKRRGHDD